MLLHNSAVTDTCSSRADGAQLKMARLDAGSQEPQAARTAKGFAAWSKLLSCGAQGPEVRVSQGRVVGQLKGTAKTSVTCEQPSSSAWASGTAPYAEQTRCSVGIFLPNCRISS